MVDAHDPNESRWQEPPDHGASHGPSDKAQLFLTPELVVQEISSWHESGPRFRLLGLDGAVLGTVLAVREERVGAPFSPSRLFLEMRDDRDRVVLVVERGASSALRVDVRDPDGTPVGRFVHTGH